MEYVWVLHEFKPQEADELPLKAGDRVAVIEKDDVYQDGWWKVGPHPLVIPDTSLARFEIGPPTRLANREHQRKRFASQLAFVRCGIECEAFYAKPQQT